MRPLSHFAAVVALFSTAGPVQASDAQPYAVAADGIVAPLTAVPGNPASGRMVVAAPKLGNCLACHRMPIPDEPDHGEIAPDLSGVGNRFSPSELRLILVNAKLLRPDTMMPGFFRTGDLYRPAKAVQGKTILTAQQIEDVVAYLVTLK